jgi:hypothetical protein
MAVFYKTQKRSSTTPISHSPTGATLGPASHLLSWGLFGQTYGDHPNFSSMAYFYYEAEEEQFWTNLPYFGGLKNACLEPQQYPNWSTFNIENFVMGNDSGFGIGTRQGDMRSNVGGSVADRGYNPDYTPPELGITGPGKIIIFINKSGMTGGKKMPSFIEQYYTGYNQSLNSEISKFDKNLWQNGLTLSINYDLLTAGTYHFMMGYGNTLYAWGNNLNGQCDIPANATSTINLKQITAGNADSLALYYTSTNGSTLVQWGATSASIPSSIGTGAIQIASGFSHSIALTGTGGVVCWGNNDFNQCNVPVGLTGITYIAAGHYHSMAIKTDGTVYCWGLTASGQCSVPASVGTGGYRIAGGLDHTILMKKDGSLTGWGGNTYKQLSFPNPPSVTDLNAEPYGITFYASFRCQSWPVNISDSVRDIRCGKYSSIAFHTGKLMWYHYNIGFFDTFTNNFTYENKILFENLLSTNSYENPIRYDGSHASVYGIPATSNGLTTWIEFDSGYVPSRHDAYIYDNSIGLTPGNLFIPWNQQGGSIPQGERWPIGRNGSFYNTSAYGLSPRGTAGNTGCWSFGYGDDGIYKQYDYFAPPDFSGISLRPRRLGTQWINWNYPPTHLQLMGAMSGEYLIRNPNSTDINLYNNGLYTNVLISKKHCLAVYHWSVGNPQYGIKWMRRDGKIITRNAIPKKALIPGGSIGFYPDLYLYELDQELTDDDAENIAIYNKWPRFDTYTGTKCIDPQAVILSNIDIAGITSGTFEVQRQIGKRIWALDGQDRAISYRSCPGITFSRGMGGIIEAGMGFVLSAPHSYEPLNCAYDIHIGDSGTHWFITGKGHTAHAKYDYSLGITLQPTMYLGLYDFHNTDYYPGRNALFRNLGSTAGGPIQGEDVSPLDLINRYLIAADQKIIEQIDIDVSGGNPPPYIIPISGVCYSSNEVVTSSPNVNGPLTSTFNKSQFLTSNQFDAAYYGIETIGEGIVKSVDGNILTLNGITGSFIVEESNFDYRIEGGTAGALYNKINPFTTPLNNGLGTTAGIGSILNNEAAGYTFDNNDPFEIFNG